jgi:hypothetical protein
MSRRDLAVILGWLWAGSLLISAAIVTANQSLHATPPLMEGPIYWVLGVGLVGAAFFAIGLRAYSRVLRAQAR